MSHSLSELCSRTHTTLRIIFNECGYLNFGKIGISRVAFTSDGKWYSHNITDTVSPHMEIKQLMFLIGGKWKSVYDIPLSTLSKLK